MPTGITKSTVICLLILTFLSTIVSSQQPQYRGHTASTSIQYSQTILSRDLKQVEYTRIVDGDESDWLGEPPDENPGFRYDRSAREYIITDPVGDTLPYKKNDYPVLSDLDIKEFRLAVDENNMYLLVKFRTMTSLYTPYVMIAIDTTPNLDNDGFDSWLPDWSDTELGKNAILGVTNSVKWDYVIGINYDWNDDPNHKFSRIVVWDHSWSPEKPIGAKVVFNKDKALIEASIPKNYLPELGWQPVMPRFRIWVVVFANEYGGIWDPYRHDATDEYGSSCNVGSDVYDVAGQSPTYGVDGEFDDIDGDPSNDNRVLGDDHWVDTYFIIRDLLFLNKGYVKGSVSVDLVLSGYVKFKGSVSGSSGVIEILSDSQITPKLHIYGEVIWSSPMGFEKTRDIDYSQPIDTIAIPCRYTSEEIKVPISDTPIIVGISVLMDITVRTRIYDGDIEIGSKEYTTVVKSYTINLQNRKYNIYVKPILKIKPGVNITVYIYTIPIYSTYQEATEIYSLELSKGLVFEIATTSTVQTTTSSATQATPIPTSPTTTSIRTEETKTTIETTFRETTTVVSHTNIKTQSIGTSRQSSEITVGETTIEKTTTSAVKTFNWVTYVLVPTAIVVTIAIAALIWLKKK